MAPLIDNYWSLVVAIAISYRRLHKATLYLHKETPSSASTSSAVRTQPRGTYDSGKSTILPNIQIL